MGDLEAVKHHIAAGTDVNVKEKSLGRTPLHNAVYYVRKEIVELLIAGGANVNSKNDWGSGETPLDWAKAKPPTSSGNTAARRVKN
jgi:ankyrin repeat protein